MEALATRTPEALALLQRDDKGMGVSICRRVAHNSLEPAAGGSGQARQHSGKDRLGYQLGLVEHELVNGCFGVIPVDYDPGRVGV